MSKILGAKMFIKEIYVERRNILKKKFKDGILLFLGNNESPMNYAGNTYQFRQDSSFLYYWGINEPNLAAVIDIKKNKEIIFGDNRSLDDIIWMGFDDTIENKAESVGVANTKPMEKLCSYVQKKNSRGYEIHYLPQYRADNIILLHNLLKMKIDEINKNASLKLIKSVIQQRLIKSDEEVAEIEKALDISYDMNLTAMKEIKAGIKEREVCGKVKGVAVSKGNGVSFPIIFSVNGEILHNHSHENIMENGQIAVLDSGTETSLGYASDTTRTIPVSGKFTDKQKEVYNIVLQSQLEAIKMMKPGVKYKEIHLHAAKVIAKGLKELGIMKGNTDKAVNDGAHALFFPHGLGHMLGLDVHDMENLGEDYIGYDKTLKRSNQFGLAYLRFAKPLAQGYVLTVEPGIYFIPALIDKWKSEKKFVKYINYKKLEEYRNFGGIRIEDNVLITKDGNRVLGKPIPKTIEEVESACSK